MQPQAGGGPVMADVARLAGVAISTVSRALANPDRVSAETRTKINVAAAKLGYTPNAMARNLRVGNSRTVLIVLPGPLHYGVSQIIPRVLHSINAALIERGYNLMIANLMRDAASEGRILDLAFGGSVCGCIILSSYLPKDGSRSLADASLPIVSMLLDMSGLSYPSVVTNDRAVMREATQELIALGHRRFFFISGPEGNYHDVERFGGVIEALRNAGLSERDVVKSTAAESFQEGLVAGERASLEFVRLANRPTAAMSVSDDMAIAFMSRVQDLGVRVPDDVSVISFDGSPVCVYCNPPLSTIEQPVEEMGAGAVALLLNRIQRNDPAPDGPLVIPSRLVLRASVSAAKNQTLPLPVAT